MGQMMQECPRCGFLQPQDQFCAYCGLDIEAFRKKTPPWYQRYFLNSSVQLTLAVLVITSTVGYIYFQQQKNPFSIEFLSQNEEPISFEDTSLVDPSHRSSHDAGFGKKTTDKKNKRTVLVSQSEVLSGEKVSDPQLSSLDTNDRVPSSTTDEKKLGKESALMGGEKNKGTVPTRLFMKSAEVTKNSLSIFLNKAQLLQETPHYQIFSYTGQPSIDEILKSSLRAIVLTGGQGETLINSQSGGFLQLTVPPPPDPLGTGNDTQTFNLNIQVSSMNELGLVIDIEGLFFLKNLSTPQVHINGSYTISPDSILVLVGIFPHRSLGEKEVAFFRQTPLSIMSSPEFLNNETEFVLLIQAQ